MRLVKVDKDQNDFKALYKEYITEHHKDTLEDTHTIFLFSENDHTIGFSLLSVFEQCFPDEDLPEKTMRIHAFYIVPSMRDKHHGQEAFGEIRAYARDNKIALLEVEPETESGERFIQKQGLELVAEGVKTLYRGFV